MPHAGVPRTENLSFALSEVMYRLILFAFTLGALVSASSAQTTVPRPGRTTAAIDANSNDAAVGSINGRVVLPNGMAISGAVKIVLSVMKGTQSISYTDQQGQFEFRNLPPGAYTIEVEMEPNGQQSFEVTRESAQVFRGMPTVVTIFVKEKAETKVTTASSSVSAAEISQKVPSKARAEFDLGTKAAKAGNNQEAILHFRRAVQIYPNYLMARNDLGALLLEAGDLEAANQELRRAVQFDPKAFNPAVNLGIVLVRQHSFAEALQILEKAESLEPGSALARLYFGLALAGVENFDRAEAELKAAYQFGGREFISAIYHLGRLYMQTGQREAARNSFALYLREAPNGSDSAEVRRLLAMLN